MESNASFPPTDLCLLWQQLHRYWQNQAKLQGHGWVLEVGSLKLLSKTLTCSLGLRGRVLEYRCGFWLILGDCKEVGAPSEFSSSSSVSSWCSSFLFFLLPIWKTTTLFRFCLLD